MVPRSANELADGLAVLRAELSLSEIMRLIERTARWVDPETFRLLPLWYPEHARGTHLYIGSWSAPHMTKRRQTGLKEHKREGNGHANKALTHALGLRSVERPNWSCCHIWGIVDPRYQQSNEVVQDRRFFSCVANMVLLPSPLKAFTDVMPEVKTMLRICSRQLYGWHCDHESMADIVSALDAFDAWEAYPRSWPMPAKTTVPLGMVPLDERIRRSAAQRLDQIRRDLREAGSYYPREEVRRTLAYWDIAI